MRSYNLRRLLLVAVIAVILPVTILAQGAFAVTAETTLDDIIAHYGAENVTATTESAGQIVVSVITVTGNTAIIYLSSSTGLAVATRFDGVYNIIKSTQFEEDFSDAASEANGLASTTRHERVIVTPARVTATGGAGSSNSGGAGGTTASPSRP